MPQNAARTVAHRAAYALALLVSIGLTGAATAQPISVNPDDPPPTLIPFRAEPKLGEHVGRVEGVVDEAGKRFYLDGLDVMSPLVIRVFAEQGAAPIKVSLHRFFWKKADLEGQTNEEGDWGYVGRVYDEVGIELKSSEPTEFYVLAWQGPAAKSSFGSDLFVTAEGAGVGETGGGSSKTAWALGILALLVVAGFVLLSRFRHTAPAAAGLLLLTAVLAPADSEAEWIEERLEKVEQGLETLNRLRDDDRDADYESRADLMTWEEFNEARSNLIEEIDNKFWQAKHEIRGIEHSLEELSLTMASEIARLSAVVEGLQLLVEEDRAAIPDPTHGGIAPMPSGCAGNPDCHSCSAAVNERLSVRLEQYERLRVIYQSTHAAMVSSLAYGDAASGWHQLEQAAWYSAKQMIVGAHASLRRAYLDKFDQFNADLRTILEDFGQCEEQYGMPDWYRRYGVIFYNSLIASYRIP